MEWVTLEIEEVSWWADVVSQTTNRSGVTSHVILLPLSKEANEVVAVEFAMEHL